MADTSMAATRPDHRNPVMISASCVAAIGGFLFGFDSGLFFSFSQQLYPGRFGGRLDHLETRGRELKKMAYE